MNTLTIIAKPMYDVTSIGWIFRLKNQAKLKYTSGNGPSGQQIHLFKGETAYVQFLQDPTLSLETTLKNITSEKMEIVKALEKSGAISIKVQ